MLSNRIRVFVFSYLCDRNVNFTMKREKVPDIWLQSRSDVFWKEIAPKDHVVQIYESDEVFLEALAGYVGGGINTGDCCIVIATQSHLDALNDRLKEHVVYIDTLISDNRYIPLNAEDTLEKFMVNGMPDEKLFIELASSLINRAHASGRRVRAFGEMVAILFAKGETEATMRLEQLWNKFCEKESICLFCAYPKKEFKGKRADLLSRVCTMHSKIIAGTEKQLRRIFYKDINGKTGKGLNMALDFAGVSK